MLISKFIFLSKENLSLFLLSVEDLIKLIVNNDYQFHENPWNQISANAKDLIQRCLCKNPKERITPTDALMHPWIVLTKKKKEKKYYFFVYYKNLLI